VKKKKKEDMNDMKCTKKEEGRGVASLSSYFWNLCVVQLCYLIGSIFCHHPFWKPNHVNVKKTSKQRTRQLIFVCFMFIHFQYNAIEKFKEQIDAQ
jgi:hypothetical protein